MTGAYVSLRLRLLELEELLRTEQGLIEVQTVAVSVASPDNLAMTLGFFQHPVWQAACTQKLTAAEKNKLAGTIVYSLAVESQFRDMTKVRKGRNEKQMLGRRAPSGAKHARLAFRAAMTC